MRKKTGTRQSISLSFSRIAVLCIVFTMMLSSCVDNFLGIESDSVIETDNYQLADQASARYMMFGIYQQLQQVADRYVILGELRTDLLSTTDNSTQDLRDIHLFQATGSNAYQVEKDLYAVINNCNYLITRLDTTITVTNSNGEKVKALKSEMAQATAIRAWAYLQLAQIYGTVNYLTTPLLSVTDHADGIELDIDRLLPLLATTLEQWVPADDDVVETFPDYGTLDNYTASQMCIPVRLILGDIYLWQNRYSEAAHMYYAHLLSNKLTILPQRNTWADNSFEKIGSKNWTKLFTTASEMQSLIQGSETYADSRQGLQQMFSLTDDYLLAPSMAAVNLFSRQTYAYSATVTTLGDLRGEYGTFTYTPRLIGDNEQIIVSVSKYSNLPQTVILYRTSTVYLRYAEAINRMGKHNMAFCLLKYGLTADVLSNNSYCPAAEWRDTTATIGYLDFGQGNLTRASIFSGNVGIHSRGCGSNLQLYRSFTIPSGIDSLLYVEDLLFDEMALETAYEGNRFADIIRIARHRNDDSFVVSTIVQKYPAAERNTLREKLENRENWFLPHQDNNTD